MKIQSYRFGHIEIDGKAYNKDVKLIGKMVVPNWWRSTGHRVELSDVEDLINADAEVCIFGTGASGLVRVADAVKSAFESRSIRVFIERTESACNTYNRLTQEGKKVVAGFHLTC